MVTPLPFLLLLPRCSLGVCQWFPVPVQGKELVLVGLGWGHPDCPLIKVAGEAGAGFFPGCGRAQKEALK